jgi:hypothetical protein
MCIRAALDEQQPGDSGAAEAIPLFRVRVQDCLAPEGTAPQPYTITVFRPAGDTKVSLAGYSATL